MNTNYPQCLAEPYKLHNFCMIFQIKKKNNAPEYLMSGIYAGGTCTL